MSAETIADLVAALRAAAQSDGPDFMTVTELAAWLRLDAMDVKDPERWIRDRCTPSHSQRLPHCRFTRNEPVFSREQRAEIKARYAVDGASADEGSPANGDARVVEFDPAAIKRGARTLGIVAPSTTA